MLEDACNIQLEKEFKLLLNKFPGQPRLEGYEFRKLAHHNKASLQFATPEFHSKGWLELVQNLSAFTLFGRGSGDIIRHSDCANDISYMCPHWRSVPRGAGYLAMSNSTLNSILECGEPRDWRLIDDVYMTCPQDPFGSCVHKVQKCDRRHFLVKGRSKKSGGGALVPPENGAVIIGHVSGKLSSGVRSYFDEGLRTGQRPMPATNGDQEMIAPGSSAAPQLPESPRSLQTSRPTISMTTEPSEGSQPNPTRLNKTVVSGDNGQGTSEFRPSSCHEQTEGKVATSRTPVLVGQAFTNPKSVSLSDQRRSFRKWWEKRSKSAPLSEQRRK